MWKHVKKLVFNELSLQDKVGGKPKKVLKSR